MVFPFHSQCPPAYRHQALKNKITNLQGATLPISPVHMIRKHVATYFFNPRTSISRKSRMSAVTYCVVPPIRLRPVLRTSCVFYRSARRCITTGFAGSPLSVRRKSKNKVRLANASSQYALEFPGIISVPLNTGHEFPIESFLRWIRQ